MRKKILTSVAAIGLSVALAFGQNEEERGFTDQGRIILGTSAGFSLTSVQVEGVDDNFINVGVNTSGGYFVVNNLALNLQLDYQYTKFGDETESSLSIGPTARYYTPPNIFIGSGYLISVPDEGESSGFIPVEIGYAYFLTRNVALEPALGALFGAHNNETVAFAFNIGLGIYLR